MLSQNAAMDMLDLLSRLLIPLMGISVVDIAAAIILAFCVYYDARARRDNMAVLWAVLSGFFSIAALVYVIVRSVSKPKWMSCTRCGQWIAPDSVFCASCGAPLTVNGRAVTQQDVESWRHRSKVLLIVWICLVVIIVVATIALFAWVVSDVLTDAQSWIGNY